MLVSFRHALSGCVLAFMLGRMGEAHAATGGTVCLFTDYGWEDPYVAQMKGAILTINPNVRLIDLTHSVAPFNIVEGAYLLDKCAEEFPAGTIFVAVVDPQVGTDHDSILVQTNKQKFYIAPDNGLLSQVIQREGLVRAWKLDKPGVYRAGATSATAHGRDIFGPVAAQLSAGTEPDQLGTVMKTLMLTTAKEPTLTGGLINAQVLHVDRYGNVILNLHSGTDLAAKLHQGNLVKISVGRESVSAPLVKNYGDVDKGRLMLVFGSSGLLEIGMNQGSAAHKLNVEAGTAVYLKP